MKVNDFLTWSERQIWMRWLLRVSEPLHRPIGNDIYVKNFWLRLSTWRAYLVSLPIAFLLGWFVILEILLYLWRALHHVIK